MLEALEVLEVILLGVPVLVFEFVGVDFLAGADPASSEAGSVGSISSKMSSGSTSWSSGFFIGRGSLHAAVGCQCGAASLSVINRLIIYNADTCNFAESELLDRPRGAQPLSRFLTVETQTGSFRGLKPKPDLPAVSRPSKQGPEPSAQAVGSGPFCLSRAPRPCGGAQGALYLP